jgi:hypothetical protein
VPEGLIYLTWHLLDRKQKVSTPTRSDVESIAFDVANEVPAVPMGTLLRAVDPITRPVRHSADADWAPDHDNDNWEKAYKEYVGDRE